MGGLLGVNNATGEGLYGFIQGAEAEVRDTCAGGKAETGNRAEAPRRSESEHHAENEHQAEHSRNSSGEKPVGGSLNFRRRWGAGTHRVEYQEALCIRLIVRQSGSHADHLRESDDGAKNHSGKINPVRMQPIIGKSAKSVAEENGSRNDKTDLGIASRSDEAIGLGGAIWIFRHDGDNLILIAVGTMRSVYAPKPRLVHQLGYRRTLC